MRVEQAKSKLPKLQETLAGLVIRCYIDGFRFRHLIGWDGVVGVFHRWMHWSETNAIPSVIQLKIGQTREAKAVF